MLNKSAYIRYRLIDERLRNKLKPLPTLLDLVDYISERTDAAISIASIQKDIYAMRYDQSLAFNAPIAYDTFKKAYYYTDPDFTIDIQTLISQIKQQQHDTSKL